MRLSTKSWLTHIYLWHERELTTNEDKLFITEYILKNGTDLCSLMRTVLVTLPIKIFFFFLCAFFLAGIVFWPFLFGGWQLGLIVWGFVIAVFGFSGAVVGIAYLWVETDTVNVFKEWVHAKKERYCPRVEFYKKEKT